MRLVRVPQILFLAAVLAACGSSTTSTVTSGAEPSAAASAAAAAPLATVVIVEPAGEVTCADVDMAASHLRTFVHYAALNVGTANDSVSTYADMGTALGVMIAGEAACAPDAAEEIDALTVAAQDAAAAYQPGDDATAIAAQKAALTAVKDAGVAAWTAMGADPAEWDLTLQFTE
jgi:hypothetical protein